MSIPFVTFRPAEYHKGKDSHIAFYVTDPVSGKLVRRKIKLNHIRKQSDRERYAKLLCHQINEKLFSGWNPLLEKAGCKAVTVSDAVDKFLELKGKSCRKDTMRSYRSFCRLFIEYMSENGMAGSWCILVEKNHVLSFLEWYSDRNRISNRTWNNIAGYLFTLFDFFRQRGYIQDNPAAELTRLKVDAKRRSVIPKHTRKEIVGYFERECPRFVTVMQLCFRLFIRPKEICQLLIRDIDFDNRTLRVPAGVSKNHHERMLGLPDCIYAYFETLREYPPFFHIFADRNTYAPGPKQMAPTRIAERWKEMREKLNLPASYQFYSLKDTGITEMLESGVPAKYVKELADHSSLAMTEKYTHRSEAMKILEWNRIEL